MFLYRFISCLVEAIAKWIVSTDRMHDIPSSSKTINKKGYRLIVLGFHLNSKSDKRNGFLAYILFLIFQNLRYILRYTTTGLCLNVCVWEKLRERRERDIHINMLMMPQTICLMMEEFSALIRSLSLVTKGFRENTAMLVCISPYGANVAWGTGILSGF